MSDKWKLLQVEGWGSYVLKEKFKLIKVSLKEWHASHSCNLHAKISNLKARQAELDDKGEINEMLAADCEELHDVSVNIHSLSMLNTSICWQQARNQWLSEGDANSKFFHSSMSFRRRHNAICFVLVNGVLVEGVEPVRYVVFSHFAHHFKAQNVARSSVSNLHFCSLSLTEGGGLIKLFFVDEVKAAVWDCDSFKSLGPNGVNFGFIKEFWLELKDDVMRFVSEFYRNGKLAKGINTTFIVLIPKVDNPQRLNDFRLISLVGSMYKILAKLLANRLRLVVSSVISMTQSAFIKNRQILDGILIANEVVDEASKLKKELMLFKVDFEKASTPLSGVIWTRLWSICLFRSSGGNGLENVLVLLQLLF